jgi:hypothetical protein
VGFALLSEKKRADMVRLMVAFTNCFMRLMEDFGDGGEVGN